MGKVKGSSYFWTGAKCICRMVGDVDKLAVEAGQAIHHQAFPGRGLSETSRGPKLEPASVGKFLPSNLSTESQCSHDTGWGDFHECLSLIWRKILKAQVPMPYLET